MENKKEWSSDNNHKNQTIKKMCVYFFCWCVLYENFDEEEFIWWVEPFIELQSGVSYDIFHFHDVQTPLIRSMI